ncbi:MAG: hypothetical protein AABZ15_15715 [Nitrospirota bacterium]
MAKLVINAPKWRAQQDNARSFETTLRLSVGESYAISKKLVSQITPGCGVILLCKDQRQRAEGTLIKLVSTTKAKNGIQRYDVHMRNLLRVQY